MKDSEVKVGGKVWYNNEIFIIKSFDIQRYFPDKTHRAYVMLGNSFAIITGAFSDKLIKYVDEEFSFSAFEFFYNTNFSDYKTINYYG